MAFLVESAGPKRSEGPENVTDVTLPNLRRTLHRPLACEKQSTETASTGSITTADSAGVEIVRVSDVHMLDLPEVELRLLHTTTTIPDLFFEAVMAATFLPDSSLVIADGRLFELTFLEPDGTVRARSGQEGEGPGEYLDITRILVGPDGAPFVFDWRQRRLTFLDSQGTVTDIIRLEQGAGLGAAVPLSRLGSGEVLAALETRPTLPRESSGVRSSSCS